MSTSISSPVKIISIAYFLDENGYEKKKNFKVKFFIKIILDDKKEKNITIEESLDKKISSSECDCG